MPSSAIFSSLQQQAGAPALHLPSFRLCSSRRGRLHSICHLFVFAAAGGGACTPSAIFSSCSSRRRRLHSICHLLVFAAAGGGACTPSAIFSSLQQQAGAPALHRRHDPFPIVALRATIAFFCCLLGNTKILNNFNELNRVSKKLPLQLFLFRQHFSFSEPKVLNSAIQNNINYWTVTSIFWSGIFLA